jgi:hypothetical protein
VHVSSVYSRRRQRSSLRAPHLHTQLRVPARAPARGLGRAHTLPAPRPATPRPAPPPPSRCSRTTSDTSKHRGITAADNSAQLSTAEPTAERAVTTVTHQMANTAHQAARCLEEEAGAVAPAAARRDGLVRRRCAGRAAVTASAAIVVVCCVLLLRPRSGAAICPRTASCAMPPPPCVSRRRLPPYHLTRRAVPCRPQSTGGRRPGCKGRRRRGSEVKPRSARPFATPRRADAGAQARLAVCFAHACASHTRRRADGHACGRARRDPRAQRD